MAGLSSMAPANPRPEQIETVARLRWPDAGRRVQAVVGRLSPVHRKEGWRRCTRNPEGID